MSEDKIWDQVDYDELVKLIEEEQKPRPKAKKKDRSSRGRWVNKFIKEHNIETGPLKVPTYVIYYHFAKWADGGWAKRYSKIEFFRNFNKHFEQKRSGHQRYYMINDSLELSEEIYEKAKKHQTKRQNRGKV